MMMMPVQAAAARWRLRHVVTLVLAAEAAVEAHPQLSIDALR